MFNKQAPTFLQDGTFGVYPVAWTGKTAPAGAALPFSAAPVGSMYAYRNTVTGATRIFVKNAAENRDDDWGQVGGSHCIQKRITRAMMTAAGAVGTFTLAAEIPAGAWVEQVILNDVTGFTGDTSATIQVGDGTVVNRYNTGVPSVFTTAVAIDVGVPSGVKIHVLAKAPVVTITSAVSFANVVAGALTLKVFYKF